MNKRFLIIALVIFALGTVSFAQEKKEINRVERKGAEQNSPAAQGLERLQLAASIAKYGRETKSASALVLAAKMLKEIPAEVFKADVKSEGGMDDAMEKKAAGKLTVESLLDDARKFAGSDKAVLDSIQAVEKMSKNGGSKGAVGGQTRGYYVVTAGATNSYTVTFRGGEEAIVAISGDGDTDLDLLVYDEYGNLVAADDGYSDDAIVRFYPRRTGRFIIRVKNIGRVANEFVIGTN